LFYPQLLLEEEEGKKKNPTQRLVSTIEQVLGKRTRGQQLDKVEMSKTLTKRRQPSNLFQELSRVVYLEGIDFQQHTTAEYKKNTLPKIKYKKKLAHNK
jgi:Zn-finger nucleic acid-binding protein